MEFVDRLDVREIHGYDPDLGFQVFTPDALAARTGAGITDHGGAQRCRCAGGHLARDVREP